MIDKIINFLESYGDKDDGITKLSKKLLLFDYLPLYLDISTFIKKIYSYLLSKIESIVNLNNNNGETRNSLAICVIS